MPRARELSRVIAATLVSAILFWLGTGLHPIWWVTWFAPLPVLFLAGRERSAISNWTVAMAAFAAWFLGSLNMWHFLHGLLGLPFVALLGFSGIPALLLALAILMWRAFLLRGKIWFAAFSLPAFFTSAAYINSVFSPHSTYGNLAYTQMNFLALIQIAAYTGIWGITFLLWLLPSAVGVLLSPAAPRSKDLVIAGVTFLLAFVLIGGAWRLRDPMLISGAANVQLISSDAPGDIFSRNDEEALSLISRYAAAVPEVNSQHPDVILMPEKIARVSLDAAEQAKKTLASAAERAGADLVVGLDETTALGRRNEALLFSKDGTLQKNYEKHHFIPGIEDGYVQGTDYTTFERPSGIWGIAICKDMDFPAMGRAYGNRGVGLLLVPAWDFTLDGWQHDRMAILRGVESGFTIARTAKNGLQTVSDSRGRLLLDRRAYHEGFVVSMDGVPVAHEDTLYDQWGDWFAWVCCGALIILLGILGFFVLWRI